MSVLSDYKLYNTNVDKPSSTKAVLLYRSKYDGRYMKIVVWKENSRTFSKIQIGKNID